MKTISQKTAIVTGANRGIGYEIAKQLSNQGVKVFLAVRDVQKGEEARAQLKEEGNECELLPMDISDVNSIKNAAQFFSQKNMALDILVNNAAIFEDQGTILEMPISLLEKTIRTNCYGALLVTREFLPSLKNGSRVINVSSGLGALSQMNGFAPAYSISKTCLNAVTKLLAIELARRNISVNAMCPGWVRTAMGGPAAPRSAAEGAETAVWLALEAPLSLTGQFLRDRKPIAW